MANINGTPVSAPITPGRDDTNTWPTHYAKFGRGGFEVVDSIAERDAITKERKTDKAVLVRSNNEGKAALYEWSNSSWNEVDLNDFIGLSVDDGVNNYGAISEIKLVGLKASQNPDDSIDSVTITAESMIDWSTLGDPTTNNKANSVIVEPPLQVFADPDKAETARMKLQEGVFEPRHAPGYLAYIAFPEKLIGKKGYHALGHYDSAIYPTDVVVDGGSFIVTDAKRKAIGVQEYDGKDPNVTGGADFLVAARLTFKGNAVNAGKIKIYLAKQPITANGGAPEYLKDVNGDLLAKEVNYKAGDKFGTLEIMSVINAKGLTEFSLHVEHTFASDLIIEDRAKGLSGIMVQALEGFSKTGQALTQYEIDTQQNIEFNKVYYGDSLMSFNWEVTHGLPMEQIQAGVGANLPDGFHLKNLSGVHIGSEDGYIYVRDAGTVCDFSLGKIFNAFDTRSLRGKEIKAKATLNAKGSPFTVALVKWTGTPNAYTNSIFSKRNNAAIVFDQGWELVDSLFFAESSTENFETATKNFTIPSDAKNFAIIVYPGVPNSPLELKIKNFDADAVTPSYAYEVYESGKINELHLHEDTEYARFTQDNEDYEDLRYTIGKSVDGQPMPCGVFRKGKANISLDPTLNQISGSAATSGEGGLKFGKDGKAIVDTTLWLHSEQPENTTSNVTFWFELVNSNNIASKIIPSETTFPISGNSSGDYSMKEFTVDVVAGDRLILKASADKDDGAFIESNSKAHPMVDIEIRVKELASDLGDDPFSGIDLSQFDTVYPSGIVVTKDVTNKSSVEFNIDLPDKANIVVLSAIKELGDFSVRPVSRLDWSYSNENKTLNVSFGETVLLGRIILGIYL